MPEFEAPFVSISLVGSFVLALAMTYVYLGERAPFLTYSTLSWWLRCLAWMCLFPTRIPWLGVWQWPLSQALIVAGGLLLVAAAYRAMEQPVPHPWFWAAALVSAWSVAGTLLQAPALARMAPPAAYVGATYICIGWAILRCGCRRDMGNPRPYGWIGLAWGAYAIVLPYVQNEGAQSVWVALPDAVLEMTMGLGLVFFYYGVLRTRQLRSEQRYRVLFEAAAGGILLIDARGRVLDGNSVVARLFGYSPATLKGLAATDLLQPEEGADAATLQAALRTPVRIGGMWGRHRSGELFPCEVTANQVSADLAEDEEILLVHVRDRSAEYYAEQALRNSEQRFRALFQRAINPILLMNAEGYYVDANGAALEFLDCTPEDLIGANVASFAPPDQLGRRDALGALPAAQCTTEAEFLIHGRIKTLLLNMVPVDLGSQTLVYAIGQDLTEHKAALQALSESQRMLSIRDRLARILLTSADDEAHGRLGPIIAEDLNSAYAMLGYVESEDTLVFPQLPANPHAERRIALTPAAAAQGALGVMGQRALLERRVLISNEPAGLPSGHIAIEHAMAGPILFDDQPIGLLLVANKPTPYTDADAELLEIMTSYLAPIIAARQNHQREEHVRHDLEERLRQGQKMEAIGRLAGGVAHDFNNLLTVINGYAQIALDSLSPESPVVGDLTEIQAAGERASALTRQLLTFSRRQAVQRHVIDLNDVLRDMSKMLGRLIGENIALDLDLAHDLWPILADVGQMEQVVMNLAVNARDAMPSGGRLTIATSNAALGHSPDPGLPPGNYVQLTLADTGVGLSDEARAHLFEPFYSTKGDRGTGLGLATVYGIVRQTAGHIEVESRPGQGTAFTIYFPRTAEAAASVEHSAVDTAPIGRERVLLVEDQDPVRQITARMLRELGYDVTEVESAEAAQQVAARQAAGGASALFDMVITDVLMPGISGPELVARLRQDRPALPALFVSGYTEDSATSRRLDPPVGLLSKPFTLEALAAATRRALDARQVPQPTSR